MIKKIIFSLLAVILTVGLVTSLGVDTSAQGIVPGKETLCQGSCPVGDPSTISGDRNSLATFIVGIARFLTFVAGALAVLFIVYGGLLFVTDNGDGSNAGKGKTIVINALLGLVIAIAAYFIVDVVGNLASGNLLQATGTGGQSK